jgi:hypothetical protein
MGCNEDFLSFFFFFTGFQIRSKYMKEVESNKRKTNLVLVTGRILDVVSVATVKCDDELLAILFLLLNTVSVGGTVT